MRVCLSPFFFSHACSLFSFFISFASRPSPHPSFFVFFLRFAHVVVVVVVLDDDDDDDDDDDVVILYQRDSPSIRVLPFFLLFFHRSVPLIFLFFLSFFFSFILLFAFSTHRPIPTLAVVRCAARFHRELRSTRTYTHACMRTYT